MKTKMKTCIEKLLLALLSVGLVLVSCGPPQAVVVGPGNGGDDTIWGDGSAEDGGTITPDWDTFDGRRITIDLSQRHQTIRGFSAADAWAGAFVGRYWNADVKEKIADLLFSQMHDERGQPKGIGLSMWRVNIGAGSYEQGAFSRVATHDWGDNPIPPIEAGFRWDHTRRTESLLRTDVLLGQDVGGRGVIGTRLPVYPDDYDFSKKAGPQFWMREARRRGVDYFVGASFSPVVAWTRSGTGNNTLPAARTSGRNWPFQDWLGNLTEQGFLSFPAYMADVLNHFAVQTVVDQRGNTRDLRIRYISPVNEPQFNWVQDSQEGSPWSNRNIARLVRNLCDAIQDPTRPNIDPVNTRILIPEASSWRPSIEAYAGNNPHANFQMQAFFQQGFQAPGYAGNIHIQDTYIGDRPSLARIFAGHTYWTHENDASLIMWRERLRELADQLDIEVWNTEWCNLGLEPPYAWSNHNNAPPWFMALYMAKLIHVDLTVANMTSWSFWTAMDIEGHFMNHYNLIGLSPGTPIYDPNAHGRSGHWVNQSGSIKAQSNLWTLGNFSLFVRPGFKRVGVTSTDFPGMGGQELNHPSGFMVSAFQSPPNFRCFGSNEEIDRVVVVYVNWLNASRTVASVFSDDRRPLRIRAYLTSEGNTNNNPARCDGLNGMRRMAHDNGVYTVPPRSVVTVVYDFAVSP